MPTTDTLRAVAVATVVLAVVTSVSVAGLIASPGFAGTAEAGHGAELGNYTVTFPQTHDQYPRSENPDGTHSTTIHHYAGFTPELYEKAGTPKGTENLSWIWVESQEIDFSQCTSADTRAFGIDRDGDDPNTQTDTDLLTYMEASHFNDNSIYVDFYEGNELGAVEREDQGGYGEGQGEGREDGDGNAEVYPDDEIIAVQEECYGMPQEPGWYQINAGGNGTGFNGQEGTIVQTSHYFYVCTCDDEQEARDELGPPPSEQGENGDEQTPTDTGDGDSPTETPEPDGDDDQQQQQGDETADTESTGTAGDDVSSPETGTTSTGDGGGGGDGEQQAAADESDGNGTPTQGNGPGLGVLATLAALAALAGLAGRRRLG